MSRPKERILNYELKTLKRTIGQFEYSGYCCRILEDIRLPADPFDFDPVDRFMCTQTEIPWVAFILSRRQGQSKRCPGRCKKEGKPKWLAFLKSKTKWY
jgi:hypothetical protein